MFIPESKLNTITPDIDYKKTSLYYLDDKTLAIRFKNIGNLEKDHLLWKYEYALNIKGLDSVVLPNDILEIEDGLCGYIENRIPIGIDDNIVEFYTYWFQHRLDITLDDITKYVLAVCNAVTLCHEQKIINPDITSNGNVLYDIKNNKVYLIDYHDMQVKDMPTNIFSPFIEDSIINTEKYYNGKFWTPNVDLYSLAVSYFYYATKISIPETIKHKSIDFILKRVGIADTEFGDCIRTLYNPNKENKDIRNSIISLSHEYELSKYKNGKIRMFVKKKQ